MIAEKQSNVADLNIFSIVIIMLWLDLWLNMLNSSLIFTQHNIMSPLQYYVHI